MTIEASEIESLLRERFSDAKIIIEDLAGDGNHYAATVISREFIGLSRVKQHQLVYSALKEELASEAIHALALKTETPN